MKPIKDRIRESLASGPRPYWDVARDMSKKIQAFLDQSKI